MKQEGHALDHVGVIVHDLDAACACYERLGFRLTPHSRHWGPVDPGFEETRWGTANRCAMLSTGYIEIAGIVDPALHTNRLETFLAQHEGCHILAFASSDVTLTRKRLLESGFSPGKETVLSRPLDEEGGDRLGFRLMRMNAEDAPEARVVFLHHDTPELMWRPEAITHPNGAAALSVVFLCVDDVAEAAARYARLLDAAVPAAGDGFASLTVSGQRLEVMTPSLAAERLPGLDTDPVPFVAGFGVVVHDLDKTAEHLRHCGVDCTIRADEIVVPPPEAGGATCVFSMS